MRQITLVEYGTTPQPVPLSPAERDQLLQFRPTLTLTPAEGRQHEYYLQADCRIGVIQLSHLAIEIRPKLPIDRVLFLLSYALDPVLWAQPAFSFAAADSLLEAIVPGFIYQVRRALRGGVLQGYRTREEALMTVRGQIRCTEQVRKRFGSCLPLEVRYDDFTEDILENQLLKAALARLKRLPIRSSRLRQELRAFDLLLANVSDERCLRRSVPPVRFHRLNDRYRDAVSLARWILEETSFDLGHGDRAARSFLVDMNQVFENFVVVALREALQLNERSFPQNAQGRRLYLDRAGQVALAPDFSWWEGDQCRFVGDVKYKRVGIAGVKHPDLYQLLAYTIAADLPAGLLIYAAGEADGACHEVFNLSKRLEVTTLNLHGPVAAILEQITDVARRVRQLAAITARA